MIFTPFSGQALPRTLYPSLTPNKMNQIDSSLYEKQLESGIVGRLDKSFVDINPFAKL